MKTEVEAALKGQWRKLRDDARYLGQATACVEFALELGLVTSTEADLWVAAFKHCPGHDDEGGRSWCSYCGTLPKEI